MQRMISSTAPADGGLLGEKVVKILSAKGMDVVEQLKIEEALLRATDDTWMLINDGVASPTVVLGISGKPEEMVHGEKLKGLGIRMVKRFSGGGTVVVDENCVMMSIIANGHRHLPHVPCYPRPVMEWCAKVLGGYMGQYGEFALREHGAILLYMLV